MFAVGYNAGYIVVSIMSVVSIVFAVFVVQYVGGILDGSVGMYVDGNVGRSISGFVVVFAALVVWYALGLMVDKHPAVLGTSIATAPDLPSFNDCPIWVNLQLLMLTHSYLKMEFLYLLRPSSCGLPFPPTMIKLLKSPIKY